MPHPVQVRNLRKKLSERFRPLIYMSDWAGRSDEEQCFSSRAVAALAVQMVTGRPDEEVARTITDCETDEGIDAVAVEGREIILVQAKWNDRGNAGFNRGDVSAVVRGMRYLFRREFERFGEKMAPHVDELTRALNARRPRVTLVLALVTGTELHHNTRRLLDEELQELRGHNPDLIGCEIINLQDMYQAILGDQARRKVDLDIELDSPGRVENSFRMYYGTVTASTVADWYAGENGGILTARNVRDALGDSQVNSTIRDSLIREPENFLYLNSGITLVCDRIEPKGVDSPRRWAPVGLHLEGANVINGAQTGDAVRRVMETHPDCAARGRVQVRIISLEDCPEDFGDRITIAANTQNPIEARDFRALEQEQLDLRDDFRLSLDRTYAIKRGEGEPARDDGCTMEEAALALAAAHREPGFAAEAKRNPAWLWERRNYGAVFGHMPTAHRVWRCVGLLRAVRDALGTPEGTPSRRATQVAEHADLLLTHALFHTMETGDLDDEDAEQLWQEQLARVPARVRRAVPLMVDVVDAAHGRTSQIAKAVTLPERATEVADRLRELLLLEESSPAEPLEPAGPAAEDTTVPPAQPAAGGRTTRAVTRIVEQGLIAEGTVLTLRPDTEADHKNLPRWVQEDPRRGQATWRNSKSSPLVWVADGQAYSPSRLVRHIRRVAMGNEQQVQGTKYWVTPDGRSLVQIAEAASGAEEDSEG
ncbi:AIPR family protein [Streptomyces nanhaiensis]|uniref:AIPR family protein n=1 Tax=Streptomyces nanhaiensis TaxID=679319 RepID=UPI00399CBB7C